MSKLRSSLCLLSQSLPSHLPSHLLIRSISLTLLVLVCTASPAHSETVELIPMKDNTIYSENNNSNGAGSGLFAGTIRTGPNRRALMHFDVKSNIPQGATITSVSLRMVVNMTRAGDASAGLHRLNQDWGEGTSNASGRGASPTTNDATWNNPFNGSESWSAGGDFVAQPSATAMAGSAAVTWTGDGLIADVQSWVNEEQEEFGWLLRVAEGGDRTAKRFASRENSSAADRPTLTVEYELAKTDQTITFDPIPDQPLDAGTLSLSATATSELPVSFSVVSGPVTLEGNVLTFTGPGEVTVRASQAGDDTFNAAPDVDQTFTINKSDQSISFDAIPNQSFERGSLMLAATASSGLEVSFSIVSGPVTIEGNVVTFSDLGPVTVRASQAGDDTFNAAPDVDQSFEILIAIDLWLMTHFTAEEILDLAISGGDADPDFDGLPNDVEFVLGLDPRAPSSLFTGDNALGLNEAGDSLVFKFSRNPNISDATINVEESADLTNWTSVASSVNGAAFETSDQNYAVSETSGDNVQTVELVGLFTEPALTFKRIRVVR